MHQVMFLEITWVIYFNLTLVVPVFKMGKLMSREWLTNLSLSQEMVEPGCGSRYLVLGPYLIPLDLVSETRYYVGYYAQGRVYSRE